MNTQITLLTSRITWKFEFWTKLQNQSIWVVQFDTWKVCFKPPQIHSSIINLNFSNCLILQFSSKFELFFKVKTWKAAFPFDVLLFLSVKVCFVGAYPNLFHFVTLNKFWKFLNLTNFLFKMLIFFKWPEIRKYLSHRGEPKYGNGEQHFNFVFSWV